MHRYYMTSETRQAVIAESNRLIAVRATLHASRERSAPRVANLRAEDTSFTPDSVAEPEASPNSVFARLVADLQSTGPEAAAVAGPI